VLVDHSILSIIKLFTPGACTFQDNTTPSAIRRRREGEDGEHGKDEDENGHRVDFHRRHHRRIALGVVA
jgi:hypothetical protein